VGEQYIIVTATHNEQSSSAALLRSACCLHICATSSKASCFAPRHLECCLRIKHSIWKLTSYTFIVSPPSALNLMVVPSRLNSSLICSSLHHVDRIYNYNNIRNNTGKWHYLHATNNHYSYHHRSPDDSFHRARGMHPAI
jgi:hypothetical protein